MYTTGQVANRFGNREITVKRWVEAYGEFLSESAQPDKGKTRLFTEADIEVFALVFEKSKQLSRSEISVLLRRGDRGIPPTGNELAIVTTHEMTKALQDAQRDIDRLTEELEDMRTRAIKAEGREELLRELLREKEAEIARMRDGG